MTDPILNMRELVEGDPFGYLSQNDRNLVMARLMAPRLAEGTSTAGVAAPSITVARGDLFLVGTGTGLFAGQDGKLAVALSAAPVSATGYAFITVTAAMRIQIDNAGTVTNYVYSGSAWTSI
jgi:hypothetical protein